MRIGFIGLGRMGQEMVLHLLEKGVEVMVYNRTYEKVDQLNTSYEISNLKSQNSILRQAQDCAERSRSTKPQLKTQNFAKLTGCHSIQELVYNLTTPRIIWLMVEHGKAVDEVIFGWGDGEDEGYKGDVGKGLAKYLDTGDIIIDGGNSFYKDSIRRYGELKEKGIHFLDVGTSGGLEGARHGACLMVGGDETIYNRVRPYLELIGQDGGVAYFGPAGVGHFVKMVHNGVEYGILQAIGEGFEILKKGPYRLNLEGVADNWNHGSVVRGWLMELLGRALKNDHNLSSIEGVVGGGSTGEWAVQAAKEYGIETKVLEESVAARKKSKTKPTFAGKVVAALRNQFGGHPVEHC